MFLDSNVLFSASQPGSAFARLIAATFPYAHVMTSDIACVEARRNLALKRPDWLATFDALVEDLEVVPSAVFSLPVTLAEKDVPLLCAAIRAQSGYSVTGDRRDFGHLFGSGSMGSWSSHHCASLRSWPAASRLKWATVHDRPRRPRAGAPHVDEGPRARLALRAGPAEPRPAAVLTSRRCPGPSR